MRICLAVFLVFLSSLMLGSCGFRPLYGTQNNADVQAGLAQVDIGNIPDREGQYLRNALIDRFYKHSRPSNAPYHLTVEKLVETLRDLDITQSSDATRAQLQLDTHIVLHDVRTGQELLSRKLHAITSYNVLASEFATRVAEGSARQNALDDLARQIELHLGLYFTKSR